MKSAAFDLSRTPVHLGLGATAVPQEPFTGEMSWYQRYTERVAADGREARLVSMGTFEEPWSMWEMHPEGHELVVCLSGRIVVHQELAGGEVVASVLEPGMAVINEPGVWHTADVEAPATALFVTAGVGTEHRPR